MTTVLGIDVGGTFTDLFFLDEATGQVRISKASTTPRDLTTGLFNGLEALGVAPGEIDLFIHGTTIATNALIERKGGRCGLITTAGFRDILELGRRERPHVYGMGGLQDPLIPRDLRFEVTERLDAHGEIVMPLDEATVMVAADALDAEGIDTVVVCFLHSYANAAHERRTKELLLARHPDWLVNLSSDLLPELYEFERTSTATIHTYVQRMVTRYVDALKQRLETAGYRNDVLFVQSNGGIMSSAAAAARPANLALSGPAAGVTAATFLAREAGFTNVISADMGGTSFDVCLIPDGRPHMTDQRNIGFRQPLRVSMLDVHAIGAGGGSIARVDGAGLLQVGPESAGADPGPAAYGRGGTQPTVTDAHLVLGRINPAFVLGGKADLRMDRGAALRAVQDHVAGPLGLTPEQGATAIIRIANNKMAGRIRVISVERGFDPRDFALVAFGGAGPLHGAALMQDVGIGRCLVPYYPGVLCALGSVVADVRHDFVRTIMRSLNDTDFIALDATAREITDEGVARISSERVPVDRVDVLLSADMAYEGQRNTLRVPLPATLTLDSVAAAFENTYRQAYRDTLQGLPIQLTSLRVTVLGIRPKLNAGTWARSGGTLADATRGERSIYFGDQYRCTPIFAREALCVGAEIDGPAIVEQSDCTTVIEPGTHARVDRLGNLILETVT